MMSRNTPHTNLRSDYWQITPIRYKGWGVAEFADPIGTVEGPVSVVFQVPGKSKITYSDTLIRMQVRKIASGSSDHQHLRYFLGRKMFNEKHDEIITIDDLTHNPCIKLTVKTRKGIFSLSEEIHYTHGQTHNLPEDTITNEWMEFAAIRSQFDAAGAKSPKYWVLPLTNFLSRFVQENPSINQHPLRIHRFPVSMSDSSDEIDRNLGYDPDSNRLIVFEFNNNIGFIEPLPDFLKRKKQLEDGKVQRTITSIIVGEVGSNLTDFPSLKKWFPFDFLPLLSVLTGSEVGAPWIEFRDKDGELVQRVHYTLGNPIFLKGHSAINEIIHHGTGDILTRFANSAYYGTTIFRVVMKNIVQGGLENRVLENSLSHLFVALDSLCIHFKLTKPQTIKQMLTDEQTSALKATLSTATATIKGMAKTASQNGQQSTAELLLKIMGKVNDAVNIPQGYGKSVVALMRQFGLHDADVIEKYYTTYPRSDNRKWHEVLSAYRGISLHRSYFDFDDDVAEADLDDVIRIYSHLYLTITGIFASIQELVDLRDIRQPGPSTPDGGDTRFTVTFTAQEAA